MPLHLRVARPPLLTISSPRRNPSPAEAFRRALAYMGRDGDAGDATEGGRKDESTPLIAPPAVPGAAGPGDGEKLLI
jgi:hypothetical protein